MTVEDLTAKIDAAMAIMEMEPNELSLGPGPIVQELDLYEDNALVKPGHIITPISDVDSESLL